MGSVSLTDRETALAAFILETKWGDIPPEVRERALLCLMDNVASALSASTARSAQIADSLAREVLPGDQATVLDQRRPVLHARRRVRQRGGRQRL